MRTDTLLKLRRGLVAAGLTVSVAGAVGVASMMNAQADQLGAAADGAAAGSDAAPAQPALLPWGAKPSKIRTGKAGATSAQLHAAGAAAAPADTSGATEPRGRYAPKGRTGPSPLKSEKTDATPPPADTSGDVAAPQPTSATLAATANYFYNVGSQAAETDGFYDNVTIAKPTLGTADYHTLAELASQSADGKQIVEVGWTVDRALNGDDDPHLFVYHWVNRVTSCYNGCGWVQVSKSVKPGDTLAVGAKKFGLQYSGGAWWVSFDSEFIGYFPASLWTAVDIAFSRAGLIQVFGEVASTTTKPCSQMGNGVLGTDKTAAAMGSATYVNGPSVALNVSTTADFYAVNRLSDRTFQYGGPGAC
jgi:hypothetical protein